MAMATPWIAEATKAYSDGIQAQALPDAWLSDLSPSGAALLDASTAFWKSSQMGSFSVYDAKALSSILTENSINFSLF